VSRDQLTLRVKRTKEEARQSYDRLSCWFDLLSGSGEYRLAVQTLDRMNLRSGCNFLEVGFGTGRILEEVARRIGPKGQLVGIDISPGMCRSSRLRLEKAGVSNQTMLTVGDGLYMPIAPQSMDGIFMGFTLELFDTPELLSVIQECVRILKPGARLGIVCMSTSDKPGISEELYLLAHKYWPRLVDCRPIDPVSLLADLQLQPESFVVARMWGLTISELVLVN
jgi:demethylmenaquinone methyltransferase/2-methoxy-6-polyprenyl-1,4-benzoquinol methylase